MKRSLLAKAVASAAALGLSAGLLVSVAPPTSASSPNIVVVGAHASEDVMAQLLAGTGAYNISATPTTPVNVPADGASCKSSVSYASSPVPAGDVLAPNGANNGRDALRQGSAYNPLSPAGNNGCVSIARSSGAPRKAGTAAGTDAATFQYYAFALDAVSWASPSLNAPAVLTPAQILGIYNCTYTNWAQVGGGSGAIQRFEPQPGSGTRSFFESAFLGGLDPTTISTPSCPAVITNQANGLPMDESEGSEIGSLQYQQAILPYDSGEWGFQGNNSINPTIDFRNGVRLGGVVATRKAADNTTIGDGATTVGSTTVTSAGNGFTAGEVGAPISGSGIPSGDTIQSVAGDGSSAAVASSGATRTVTDGVTNKTIPCVNTTAGSKNITINTSGTAACPASPAVSFVSGGSPTGDVGSITSIGTGNGIGIADGATITSVTDATHAVLSSAATATNNGDVAGSNAITLYLDGGQKTISSATASFVSADVGKVISGSNLPTGTTLTGISGDGRTAFLSAAASAANTGSNTWTVDDPRATASGSALTLSIGTSTTTSGSSALTTVNGTFTSFDVGATVSGGGIPGGTTITAVSGNNATLSQNASATATPSVTITDLSENDVHWDGLDAIWVANLPTADPRGPVTEVNISLNSANPAFPGIRYMFNVIDTVNPYWPNAEALIGFTNGPGGSVPSTSICAGAKASTINSYGLSALNSSNPGGTITTGPNQAGSDCRQFVPH